MAADSTVPGDLIEVGRIVGAHGIRGEVQLQAWNAEDSVLHHVRRLWLRPGDRTSGGPGVAPAARAVRLRGLRGHEAHLIAALEGVSDRNAAEALRGTVVLVSRAEFPPTDDDEYYWSDLVGCEVVDPQGLALGSVTSVEDQGAGPLLRIDHAGKDRLIPFVAQYVLEVQPSVRRIVADWRSDWD